MFGLAVFSRESPLSSFPIHAYPKSYTYFNMVINTFARGSARPNSCCSNRIAYTSHWSGLVALVAIALTVCSRPELTVNHSIPEPSTAALLGLG